MATDSSTPYPRRDSLPDRDESVTRNPRFKGVSESTAVNPIVGVAMVGLLGGGPRLAIRAARVVLADSYATRSSGRLGGLPRRPRQRGEQRGHGSA
jgi:hypothetical protein